MNIVVMAGGRGGSCSSACGGTEGASADAPVRRILADAGNNMEHR